MNDPAARPDAREARGKRGPTRIGDWVLHADLGVLRRDGAEVRLNAKALHALLVMLDAGGKAVSRDTLLERVWGATYPSDNVVSRAMADLRAAFGEKAGEQKFIRTLPKFGYQLVADHGAAADLEHGNDAPAGLSRSRRYPRHYIAAGILAAALLVMLAMLRWTDDPVLPESRSLTLAGQRPLTSAPGLEHQPRIVPGGEWVVHAVLRRERNDWDLFRVALSDGEQQPVAVTPGVHEHGPAISPLGDELAYVRLSDEDCAVVVQSLTLGVPETVATCTRKFPTLVDWSPAGHWIAHTAARTDEADGLRRIYSVNRLTGERRRISDAVSPTGTDFYPRFSPDGSLLAFLRGEPQPDHRSTLWLVKVGSGEERSLTDLPAQLGGMAWLNTEELIYSFADAGRMYSRLLNIASGEIRPIQSAELVHPEVDTDGDRLVAVELRSDRDLTFLRPGGDIVPIARSTSDDHHGRLSPDEAWVAFISRRSGFDELWIAALDGSATRRLTRFDGATVRYPDWHPDGRKILFTVQADSGERLYEADIVGGGVSPVATPFAEITSPRYLPAGDRWVASCLGADGWGICTGDDADSQRVAGGYFRPQPLDDDAVAVVDETGSLFRLSLSGGAVEGIWDGMPGGGRVGWTLDGGRVLFLHGGDASDTGRLLAFDLRTGTVDEQYAGLLPLTDTNVDVGRRSGGILFTRFASSSDDLVVFENFSRQLD